VSDLFGDYDPDDAWDATDAVADQLAILTRRIAWLADHPEPARIQRIVDDVARIRQRVISRDL
jgi:hypothetical protein